MDDRLALGYWLSSGKEVNVTEMTDNHLVNLYRMLYWKASDKLRDKLVALSSCPVPSDKVSFEA
jgi:hypothetical protein